MDKYQIWTDGSCNNNPSNATKGFGGWGFVLIKNDKVIFEDLGFEKETTSNRMEMLAVIKGLNYVTHSQPNIKIEVYSDSAYVVNCFIERWYIRWQEMDWDEVKNSDLWKEMLYLYHSKLLRVKFVKVKGHSGVVHNERADYLAGQARKHNLILNGVV